ncbi:MAG: hypothetical protein A2X34_05145 [Elusimicrobia bacterium GWC2_51_8]|nr:MAG: hypothetical protein A2X33_04745 [Elusimicrobia bacterium GWA2_51_34]OGR58427.1 MAG: hypothetical protein A2X34_05145 [Elusimicrobia bacterium GWC2_51_8]OGR86872.1 MAG: hypothetical protein A2021_04795 [Elusimicrobia bacterium GWF2_52_66]HAF96112.1 hypothetical protein [Elusimicrobiota bacterium]HCE97462.1 hypothetical protein [Elusimicrobiota bacterium]
MGICLRRAKTDESQSAPVPPVTSRIVPVAASARSRSTWLFSPGKNHISVNTVRFKAGCGAPASDAQSTIVKRYNPKRRLAPF